MSTIAASKIVSTQVRDREAARGIVWRPALYAGVVYACITLFITYPLALHITSALPGGFGDTAQHLWSLWWTKKALLELGQTPDHLTYLYSPTGMYHPLLWVTPYVQLLAIPLQSILGLIGTYNLLLLLSFPLCGFTMYLLGYYLTKNHWAAFIAGLIFAFFPGKLIHAPSHYLQLPIYWFPLYVLYLFKLVRSPSYKNALLCGIFLALSSLVHIIHMAYFVIPVTIVFLIFQLSSIRKSRLWLRSAGHAAVAAGVAFLMVAPFYVPYLVSSLRQAVDYIYTGGDVTYSADLLGFFVPFRLHPFWRSVEPISKLSRQLGADVETLAFVGWLPLGLALIGWYTRRRQSRMWWVLSGVAAILSLGPFLHLNGQLVEEKVSGLSSYIVLPYALLKSIPFYEWGRTPGRFNETVMFGVAILAAFGLSWLMGRTRSVSLKWIGTVAIASIVVFEYLLWWPFPLTALPATSAFYATMRGSPDDAVLTVPAFFEYRDLVEAAGSRDMYFQTIHQHKVAGGYIWRWSSLEQGRALAFDELLVPEHDIEIVDLPPTNDIAAILRRYGIRYVVVYKPWERSVHQGLLSPGMAFAWVGDYTDPQAAATEKRLRQLLGSPVFEDTLLWAFEVPDSSFESDNPTTMLYLGAGWRRVKLGEGKPWRWMTNDGHLIVERFRMGYARLSFQAVGASKTWLDVRVNGQRVQRFPVSTEVNQYVTEPIILAEGSNEIVFSSPILCLDEDPDCTSIRFAEMSVEPLSLPVDRVVEVELEENISMVRFGQSRETVRPGEALTLALIWRADAPVTRDYKVFVHVKDAEGRVVLQHDVEPDEWEYPTSQWVPGTLVRDQHPLLIPSDLQPGVYSIEVGMYLEDTLERLRVVRSSEPSQDNAVTVGTFRVVAGEN